MEMPKDKNVWRVRHSLLMGIFSLGAYGCVANEQPSLAEDVLAEKAHQSTESKNPLFDGEKPTELQYSADVLHSADVLQYSVKVEQYLENPNNAKYLYRPFPEGLLPEATTVEKELAIESLEHKIMKRPALEDIYRTNQPISIVDWPKDHSKLAKLYFSQGKSQEGFNQLEFLVLYHFNVGRRLGKHYEGIENYPKAYLYYALSWHRGEYNAEKFEFMYPEIARLGSKLNDDDRLWIESEISRHVKTRQVWARQMICESNSPRKQISC